MVNTETPLQANNNTGTPFQGNIFAGDNTQRFYADQIAPKSFVEERNKDNTMLYLIFGAIAFYLLVGKK